MKNINKPASLAIITASLLLGFSYAFAWTAPTQQPPAGNVEAPLNTGTTGQYKAGALGFEGVLRGYSDAIFDGKVGIGTGATALTESLEVNGGIKAKNGTLRAFSGSGYNTAWTEYSWTHLNTAPDTWRKIATMPASSGSTGDQLWLKVRVSGTSSTNAASADVRMGQRSSFNASISNVFGTLGQLANAGIRAYQQVDGTTDVYAYHKNATYIGLAVEASAVGFAGTATMVSPSAVTSTTATPTGTLVFDSTTEYTNALTAITSAGNVGIGTPAPGAKLDVRAITYAANQNGGIQIGATTGQWLSGFKIKSNAGGTVRTTIDATDGTANGTSNEAISIIGSGNVGIGTPTPGAALEVAGQVKITGGTPGLNKVLTSDATGLATWQAAGSFDATNITTGVGIGRSNTMAGSLIVGANSVTQVALGAGDLVGGGTAGGFQFDGSGGNLYLQTATANASGTWLLGRKSRGTMSAAAAVVSGDDTLLLRGYGYDGASYKENARITFDTEGTIGTGIVPGVMQFATANPSGVLTNRMTIDSDGYVGVGTMAPAAKLDVAGSTNVSGELDVTGGTGTSYTTAPIEVRTTLTPRISFHWPGVVASQLGMDSAGTIRTYDNPGTGYAAFAAGAATFNADALVNGITVGKGGGNVGTNTAIGGNSLIQNTTGYGNTASGLQSLTSNKTGLYNTANGYRSLYLTTADGNTATGASSLYNNSTGYSNTAVGMDSSYWNATGHSNTSSGYRSLYANTTGYGNTANGLQSLYANTTGAYNIANGYQSLYSNTVGAYNTASGYRSLYSNNPSTGNGANTATGAQSLYYNTTGINNTAIGYMSLYANTTGSQNTGIGYGAGGTATLSNTTAIGYSAVPAASNYVRIGNTAVTQIGGQVAWSNLSDARQKENVVDYAHGLDFIMKLRPVTYNLIADKTKVIHSGFIAQEVEATGVPFYGLNKPANDKDFYSLNYSEFVVPLVNSVKELKEENDKLRADNEALLARIEKIEAKIK